MANQKPSLTTLLLTPEKEQNIQSPPEVSNLHIPQQQHFPAPPSQKLTNIPPSITKLNPIYNPELKQMRIGERMLYYMSQIKKRFPKTLFPLVILILVAIFLPLIAPVFAVGGGVLGAFGM